MELPGATGVRYIGFEAVGTILTPVPEGKCALPIAVPAAADVAVPSTVVL